MSTARRRNVPSYPYPSYDYPSTSSTSLPSPGGSRSSRRKSKLPLGLSPLTALTGIIALVALYGSYRLLFGARKPPPVPRGPPIPTGPPPRGAELIQAWHSAEGGEEGHADFRDGRKRSAGRDVLLPQSEAMGWVNVMLGNGGPEADLSGGMIPSVAPPFAMTRWTPQTRENYVSMCPYNQTDTRIHGFLGTHQPAVWMGESGPAQIAAGLGQVITDFDQRGLPFDRADEYASANYYSNILDAGDKGKIKAELSATSRAGHVRYTFAATRRGVEPFIVVQGSRASRLMHAEYVAERRTTPFYPKGRLTIDTQRNEIYGWNDERQDRILVSEELPAAGFKGYFVARFSTQFKNAGMSHNGVLRAGVSEGEGDVLAGYVTFEEGTEEVEVRIGVSFISVDQARLNLDVEIPFGQTLEQTARQTRSAWSEKLDMLAVDGATEHNKTVLFTSYFHTLHYPSSLSEPISTATGAMTQYYSGYIDQVVRGASYTGYSLWDTFRAQSAWMLLTVPERVGEMITSMLQDYEQGGWLPMWKNVVETNIMVGTHADSVIAQAMAAGVRTFDWDKAWLAVQKNAFQAPNSDTELKQVWSMLYPLALAHPHRFADREEHVPQEVRAGLTEYMGSGYVANDLHAEAASRTLDYAYDDHAVAIVAEHTGHADLALALRDRSKAYKNLWNRETGFMESRNSDGTWAGENEGWTEGDHWAYSLSVMHDVPGLIELMGGNDSFVAFLDRHFEGGHNLHTNEPSHHIPYLYSYAGAPHKSQEWVRHIGQNDYNHTAAGLSGNEDCGQMSAWYLFSALGFYPGMFEASSHGSALGHLPVPAHEAVDPASATYVIGAPYFDFISLRFPGAAQVLIIAAHGASAGKKYIKSLTINGRPHDSVFISHSMIAGGGHFEFEMADTPQEWGKG